MSKIQKMCVGFALVLCAIAITSSIRQEFTFYDRFRSQAEDSITLTRHYPNITGSWDFFLKLARGRCVQGEWATYLSEDYNDIHFRMLSCSDHAEGYFANVKSLRYLGASDTSTQAISLYEGILYQGKEFFTSEASSEIGPDFQVNSIVTTGSSNWALYEGANFTGRRVFIPGGEAEVYLIARSMQDFGIGNVRSFERVDL